MQKNLLQVFGIAIFLCVAVAVLSLVRISSLSRDMEILTLESQSLRDALSKKPSLDSVSAPDAGYDDLTLQYYSLSSELDRLKTEIAALSRPPAVEPVEPASQPMAQPLPDLTALEQKMAKVEGLIAKMEEGPTYLSPYDRIALKSEVENVLKMRDQEQEKQRTEQFKTRIMENLSTELALSDFQKEQAVKIIDQRFLEFNKLREDIDAGKLKRDDMQAAWGAIMTKTDEEFGKILDANQVEQYKKLKEEQPWLIGGGGGRQNR